jgi:thioesterase domain-containing protein
MNILDLPYNQHVGLKAETVAGDEILCLEPDYRHLNHVGTIHASAIFSLAEAASGHALLLQFPHLSDSTLAVLREAVIKYRKPATGKIRAISEIDGQEATSFSERLASKGRGTIRVSIKVLQKEDEVFVGTYSWFASRSG